MLKKIPTKIWFIFIGLFFFILSNIGSIITQRIADSIVPVGSENTLLYNIMLQIAHVLTYIPVNFIAGSVLTALFLHIWDERRRILKNFKKNSPTEIVLKRKYSKQLLSQLRKAAQNLKAYQSSENVVDALKEFNLIGREFRDEEELGEAIQKIEQAARNIARYYTSLKRLAFNNYPAGLLTGLFNYNHDNHDDDEIEKLRNDFKICDENLEAIIKCTKVVIYES